MCRRISAFVSLALLSVCFTGCRKDEIVTYRLVKDPAPAPAASPAAAATPAPPASGLDTSDRTMANTAVATASGPGLAWDAPASWTAGPERPMRKATFLMPGADGAPGAELAVTAFPGDVGGNLANINRWRQQLSLAPISETELGATLKHIDVGPLHVDYIEIAGAGTPPATRLLGALVPYAGSTWFFKLTGPADAVAREQAAFLAFLRTLRPAG